ncbi:MAG: DMT family transporter [Hyphomicrobiaceae bacterium]|nr:DMT family transporter [Hyphomicrobiaceae bacterium]
MVSDKDAMLNLLLLVLMPAAFALNPVVGRALTGAYEPGQLTFVRWLAAGVLVAMLAAGRKDERWRPHRNGWWRILALGALGMGFCGYSAYAGAQAGTATNVSLIYACTTALVVLYEIASRRVRPDIVLLAGVGICMAGAVTIISRGRLDLIGAIEPNAGDLWALAGMTVWAVYTVAMKQERSGLSPLALFAVMSLSGAAAALPVAVVETVRGGAPSLDLHALAWISALVLVASVGSYLSYNLAIRRTGPILTSAALSLSPLHTAVLAMLLVGERLGWYHAAGGALVILGLATINVSRARS